MKTVKTVKIEVPLSIADEVRGMRTRELALLNRKPINRAELFKKSDGELLAQAKVLEKELRKLATKLRPVAQRLDKILDDDLNGSDATWASNKLDQVDSITSIYG